MLFPAAGWERVRGRIAAGTVEPALFTADGAVVVHGREIGIDEAGIDAAWFGLDLFPAGQDEVFLATLLHSPSLRWMQSGRTGYDHPAFAALARRGVRLSISNGPAPAIAEYVMANVLDLFQRGRERRAAQAAAQWTMLPFREVAGSRWVCLGFGAIGRETARRARAFGGHVTGVRRSGGEDSQADAMVRPNEQHHALARADVVVLAVPLTAETENAYGEAFFAAIKPGALFVNVGRGPLVDEDALRVALDTGILSHAVLDVARAEPLPPGAWQWMHPKVTVTGHTAGVGSGLIERTDALLVENLRRYVAGERLLQELGPEVFA